MSKFTNEEIVESARRIVAEKGLDYIYEKPKVNGVQNCVYATNDGAPSCLVGHVIADIDPDLFEKVKAWEDGTLGRGTSVDDLSDAFPDEFTYNQVRALGGAQWVQDQGLPWGEAFSELAGELEGWED